MKIFLKALTFNLLASFSFAQTFQTYSKFDFVPSEKVVAVEDFSQTAIGDFPLKWNSNGSGEGCDFSMMYKIPKLSCQTNE
ncbi:MAG: hypothetical protein EAZ67_13905 [Cytophagales bacterium]|nr:MAG: hypothetical protein EAZ67_13905 [Cytophagales bacterium]